MIVLDDSRFHGMRETMKNKFLLTDCHAGPRISRLQATSDADTIFYENIHQMKELGPVFGSSDGDGFIKSFFVRFELISK